VAVVGVSISALATATPSQCLRSHRAGRYFGRLAERVGSFWEAAESDVLTSVGFTSKLAGGQLDCPESPLPPSGELGGAGVTGPSSRSLRVDELRRERSP